MTIETEMDTREDKIATDIIQKIRRRAEEIRKKPRVNSCIFRGEAQAGWGEDKSNRKVSSSLYRMLKKNLQEESSKENINSEFMPETILPFERSIMENAKKHIGENALAIEVLSELQHYGGKTNLIDFTKDLHVALFFACSESPEKNGRIILLPLDPNEIRQDITYPQDDGFGTLPIELLGETPVTKRPQKDNSGIKNLNYSKIGYILVEPTGKSPRPIFQSSIFIHPLKGHLDENLMEKNSIIVKANNKKAILQYLKKYYNINWSTIYNDIHGYIQNQENDRSMQFFFGLSAHIRESHRKAIDYYNKAIETGPQFADVYLSKGLAYTNIRNPEKAIESYTNAIALDPQNASTYFHRGFEYFTKRKHEDAIKDFDKAIELNQKFARAYFFRGFTYTMKGKYENAITDFNKSIDLNSRYADTYFHRGRTYAMKQKYETAIADYTKAIEINPQYTEAYFCRGHAYAMKQKYENAILDFNKAIEINPQYADAYIHRAQLHLAKENCKEALYDAKRAQTLYQEESNDENIRPVDDLIQRIKDACPDLS